MGMWQLVGKALGQCVRAQCAQAQKAIASGFAVVISFHLTGFIRIHVDELSD